VRGGEDEVEEDFKTNNVEGVAKHSLKKKRKEKK
jgi:hypothetical protein